MTKILVQAVGDAVVYSKEGFQIANDRPVWVDNSVTVIKAIKSGHLKELTPKESPPKASAPASGVKPAPKSEEK